MRELVAYCGKKFQAVIFSKRLVNLETSSPFWHNVVMVYKNDAAKLKNALRNFRTRMISIFAFAIVFNFILFYLVMPKIQPDMAAAKNIFLILFPLLALYCGVLVFIFGKKLKKDFFYYSIEITDDKIIETERKSVKEYPLLEVKKIKILRANKYLVIMNNSNRLYTSEFLENQEDFNERLTKIKEPQKGSFERNINTLSWVFCIGFFASRFIPNIWVYIVFSIGFIVVSIFAIYRGLHMNIKPGAKIFSIIFYILFDALIINALISTLKHIFQ